VTAPPPRRPWWKRKRTWAAVALWLVVGYPLSMGPVAYCVGRGWVADATVEPFYSPIGRLFEALEAAPQLAFEWFTSYLDWCLETGERHAASD